jgi:hypothetical protein
MNIFLIVVIVLTAIVTNVIIYKVKLILKDNGYYADYLLSHITDIPNFIKLIIKEKDKRNKQGYLKILLFFFISLVIFLSASIVMILREFSFLFA